MVRGGQRAICARDPLWISIFGCCAFRCAGYRGCCGCKIGQLQRPELAATASMNSCHPSSRFGGSKSNSAYPLLRRGPGSWTGYYRRRSRPLSAITTTFLLPSLSTTADMDSTRAVAANVPHATPSQPLTRASPPDPYDRLQPDPASQAQIRACIPALYGRHQR